MFKGYFFLFPLFLLFYSLSRGRVLPGNGNLTNWKSNMLNWGWPFVFSFVGDVSNPNRARRRNWILQACVAGVIVSRVKWEHSHWDVQNIKYPRRKAEPCTTSSPFLCFPTASNKGKIRKPPSTEEVPEDHIKCRNRTDWLCGVHCVMTPFENTRNTHFTENHFEKNHGRQSLSWTKFTKNKLYLPILHIRTQDPYHPLWKWQRGPGRGLPTCWARKKTTKLQT